MGADERAGLRLTIVGQDEPVVVQVGGELDLSTVPEFVAVIDEVLELKPPAVELDLSEVSFIVSSGVGAYVSAFRRARAAGTQLALGPRSPFVARVLQISGVEDALAAESA
jgi:anti-sigma B factor antagonist